MSTGKSKAKTDLQTEYWHQYQWREAGVWWRGEGCREGARQPACTGALWVAGKARQEAETSHLSSARREHSPAAAGGTPEHHAASVSTGTGPGLQAGWGPRGLPLAAPGSLLGDPIPLQESIPTPESYTKPPARVKVPVGTAPTLVHQAGHPRGPPVA